MSKEAPRKLSKRERAAVESTNAPSLAAKKAKQAAIDRRNRRLVLTGIALVSSAVVLGGANLLINNRPQAPEMPKSADLLDHRLILHKGPEVSYQTTKTAFQLSDKPLQSGVIDRSYLKELFSQLQQETSGTVVGRTNRVINNLSLVITSGEGGGSTNALMLDESGIFLTCGHTFVSVDINTENYTPDKPNFNFKLIGLPAKTIYPALMQRYPASQYLADAESDLAIFYAPTGYRRRKIDGIQIRTEKLMEGQNLWQTALFANNTGLYLRVMSGSVVSDEKNIEINKRSIFSGRVGVVDMIPFGGSSGSPIIDVAGSVVGVESGFFVKEGVDLARQINRSDYAGSAISPLQTLNKLITNGNIVNLPS